VSEEDLRFKHIEIGHRQLLSYGVGMSRKYSSCYFFQIIDRERRLDGRVVSVPWAGNLLIRDSIRRDIITYQTEVDKIRGHLTRFNTWNLSGWKRPIRNAEITEKCRIVHPSEVTTEFDGLTRVNRLIPRGAEYDPSTPYSLNLPIANRTIFESYSIASFVD